MYVNQLPLCDVLLVTPIVQYRTSPFMSLLWQLHCGVCAPASVTRSYVCKFWHVKIQLNKFSLNCFAYFCSDFCNLNFGYKYAVHMCTYLCLNVCIYVYKCIWKYKCVYVSGRPAYAKPHEASFYYFFFISLVSPHNFYNNINAYERTSTNTHTHTHMQTNKQMYYIIYLEMSMRSLRMRISIYLSVCLSVCRWHMSCCHCCCCRFCCCCHCRWCAAFVLSSRLPNVFLRFIKFWN